MNQNQNQPEIKIKINDEQLKGAYANMMRVSHQQDAFIIDFANITPPQGIVTARVITSPGHLKKMIKALQENLSLYEDRFGSVEEQSQTEGQIGFQTS